MLLPAVTEALARVVRHPAVDQLLMHLRQGSRQESLAGPTDPVKALVAAVIATELRRPMLVLVENERRAAALLEPLQFFSRALGGGSGISESSVALLPAFDVLPGHGVGPHPEILQTRAATLWRLATGQASVIVAPVTATLMSFASSAYYGQLSQSLERDQDISLDAVLSHLAKSGYVRTELVEMPGQFALRGGILDAFPPESPRPVRIELLGDTVESLREFDPETQRSTGPVNRVTLPPLTEFQPSSGNGFHSATLTVDSEHRADPERPVHTRTVFDLRDETLVILDEPEAVERAAQEWRDRLQHEESDDQQESTDNPSETPALMPEDKWRAALEQCQRVFLEQLALQRGDSEPNTLHVQQTTRYHGQVPAFLAEARGRVVSGEQVLITAASTGELERLADLCREYEVPYRLGELDASITGARLVEDSTSGSAPAVALVRAPLCEGFLIPGLHLAIYGTEDLFETMSGPAKPRQRPRTAGFFSDFSELKPGDYVVHMDHGIGHFRDCKRWKATAGAASSCVCPMRTTRGSTFRSNAWTWCRLINRSKARNRRWIAWAARFGALANRA